jgi:hypothetical protein
MPKIVFDIDMMHLEDEPQEPQEKRRYATMPNCFGCGRFCRMRTYQEYNGTWNIWYADVTCSKCGEYTESLT